MYMDIVRANITCPKTLLLEVDKLAGSRNRSAFLADSVRECLARLKFSKVAEDSIGILNPKDYPNFATPTKVKKYTRAFRKKNSVRV